MEYCAFACYLDRACVFGCIQLLGFRGFSHPLSQNSFVKGKGGGHLILTVADDLINFFYLTVVD